MSERSERIIEHGERSERTARFDRGTVAAVVGLLLLFALPLWGLLRAEGGPMEEGFMLVFPERVLRGDVPNVDFLHLYGPGSLWVLAGAFELFGTSLVVERLVALVQQVGVVLAVFFVARPWGRTVAFLGAAICAVVTISPIGLVALAWVGALTLGLWSVHVALLALRSGRSGLFVVAGVLGGLALLYRPDLVVALGLGLGVVAIRVGGRDRLRLAAGLVAGAAPILVHLVMAGPAAAWRGMVIEPVFDLRDGRRLPIPPSATDLDGFLQKIAEIDALDWPAPLNTPQQLRAWFFVLLVTAAVLVGVGRWAAVRRPSWRSTVLLAVAVFSLGLLPQALQRPDSTHLAWVSAIPLGLLPVALAEVLEGRVRRPGVRGLVAGGAVIAMLLLLFPFFTARRYVDYSLQTFGRSRSAHAIRHDGRTFYYGRADVADELNELLHDVDARTEPGDRLFVGPSDLRFTPYVDSFVYFLLPDLTPATRYIEMDPGVANAADSGLADELATADVVILGDIWSNWVEPNSSTDAGSDEPNEVLRRDFCLDRDYGSYEVFYRCDA